MSSSLWGPLIGSLVSAANDALKIFVYPHLQVTFGERNSDLLNLLAGKWTGTIEQKDPPKDYSPKFYIELNLARKGSRVVGAATITGSIIKREGMMSKNTIAFRTDYKCDGIVASHNYLYLQYKLSPDPNRLGDVAFGQMLLKVDNNVIEGGFLGRGDISKTIVAGKVYLDKKN